MKESELWLNFLKGKNWALTKIFRDNYDLLFYYGRSFSLSDEVIKDLIQDLFLKLWTSRRRLSHTDKIKPYLLRSFRSITVDFLKEEQKTLSKEFRNSELNFIASIEENWILKESNKHLVQKVKGALKLLNNREREVIYLKFYFKLDNRSIARIMDIKYQSVKNLYTTALVNLRKKIKIF